MTPSVGRVLMTTDTVGGVFSYAVELARALDSAGVEVALAAMGGEPSRAQRGELRGLPGVELFASAFKLEWMQEPWDDVARAGDWLLRLEERVAPGCVHCNGYAHGALRWRAPAIVVGHSCVLSWWRAVHGSPPPREWDRYRAAVQRGLSAARVVVAPSRAMLAELQRLYGPFADARVIPNAVHAPQPATTTAKQPFILAAGRLWDEAKNVRALCAAAPDLPWPVFVAGDARPPPGALVDGAGARALPSGVRALGPLARAELARWYAQASIYALPARYEPFGLSVLEAALGGCALVLGDIPSLRENWSGAALLVPSGDRAALCDALRSLIGDPALRAELSEKARSRAHEFAPERMAGAYLAAYADALRAVAGRPEESGACA